MARRTKEQALATREAILDAAVEIFHDRGVARPSLSDVARLAGVTRGAVYGHFRNKADLFSALCDRVRLPMEALCGRGQCTEDAGPLALLRANWVTALRDSTREPGRRKILDILLHRCEHSAENAAIVERLHQGYAEAMDFMRGQLSRAVAQGELPADLDVDAASALLHGSLVGVMYEWLAHPEAYDLPAEAERYIDALLEMLRCAPTLRRRG